jgi:multidrug transporter EmrE-like cation transporter
VAVATLVSFVLFKERISRINLTGLAFAAAAIILIVLSS